MNEDGKKASITFPSAEAQADLIRDVIQRNAVNPRDIVFLEAHGTGTQVPSSSSSFSFFSSSPPLLHSHPFSRLVTSKRRPRLPRPSRT